MSTNIRPSIGLSLVVAGAILAAVAMTSLAGHRTPSAGADEPGASLPTCGDSAVEFLGFSDTLNKTNFGGFGVTELSGIAFDRTNGAYNAVADRAGAVQSHVFSIDVPITSEALGTPVVQAVTVLKDATATPYNGQSLDGEGIAITTGGEIVVASEGGSDGTPVGPQQPEVRVFAPSGDELASLTVPARFLIGTNNLSFESASITPNGHSLFTANERPLPSVGGSGADGQTADFRQRIRILRYENRGADGFVPAEQFYYLTEPDRVPGDVGVTELIALSETHLLVLERGFQASVGNTVRVFLVSLQHASDVSDEPSLAAPGLVPVEKTLLVDVGTCPTSGATNPGPQVNPLLDNFEGMTLGPELAGGRRALILVSDDNSSNVQVTRIIALAVPLPMLVGSDAP